MAKTETRVRIAAVAGAIAGDGFSFWLGHRYHRQILRGWPLNRFPWVIERSAQLIRKYGIASVFLARFTAVVRAEACDSTPTISSHTRSSLVTGPMRSRPRYDGARLLRAACSDRKGRL